MSVRSINKRLNDFISSVSPLYEKDTPNMHERHEANKYNEDCDCKGECTPEKKSKCGSCKDC